MRHLYLLFLFLFTACCAQPLAKVEAPKAEAKAVVKYDHPVMLEINEFTDTQVKDAIRQLREWDGNAPEIWIRIDTNGGRVDNGFKLIKQIEKMKTKTICLADTRAYSMGFGLLQACKVRAMTPRSILMLHEVIYEKTGGTSHDLKRKAKDLEMSTKLFAAHCRKRMKISKKDYLEKVTDKEWFFDYEEALKVGAVDKVIQPEDVPALTYQVQAEL